MAGRMRCNGLIVQRTYMVFRIDVVFFFSSFSFFRQDTIVSETSYQSTWRQPLFERETCIRRASRPCSLMRHYFSLNFSIETRVVIDAATVAHVVTDRLAAGEQQWKILRAKNRRQWEKRCASLDTPGESDCWARETWVLSNTTKRLSRDDLRPWVPIATCDHRDSGSAHQPCPQSM